MISTSSNANLRKVSQVSGHLSTSSKTTLNEDECLNNVDLKCQKQLSKNPFGPDSLNTSGSSITEEIFNNAINFLTDEDSDHLDNIIVHPI